MRIHFLLLLISLTTINSTQAEEKPTSYYLIGNSLTWDTLPGLLDGDVQWHVDCGKSLPFIYEHPEAPCVKSSKLWPAALKEKQYAVVSVQPHYGSTLKGDVEVISKWLAMRKRPSEPLLTAGLF